MDSNASERRAALFSRPLTLRGGAVIGNRLAKSAMSEALGTIDNRPTDALATLYCRWAAGRIGLCITGNVMTDRRALGEPRNVAVEDAADLPMLRRWAEAGSRGRTQLWMQINHPGKQAPRGLNAETVAPSAVPFRASLQRFFDTPRELREPEIEEIVERFGRTAAVAKEAGFGGVQIHGAHGYLVSQFLSPHHNRRTDAWGGSPERRMRFVVEVYREIRRTVGDGFPVGIKLNSADFQRGGFTEGEALDVVAELGRLGIDLIEISGGNYEAPAMSGVGRASEGLRQSTREREAYFLVFAEQVRARSSLTTPLMVTGGFRSARGMAAALESGAVDLVGLARPLAIDPDLPRKLLAGDDVVSAVTPRTTGIAAIDRAALLEVAWYSRQLKRMGHGREPQPDESARLALVKLVLSGGLGVLRTRLRG
jgi:2,4-dienoyl-CoA reductase-like NADH-dependent reductase (Old Yellow Enzyme family)